MMGEEGPGMNPPQGRPTLSLCASFLCPTNTGVCTLSAQDGIWFAVTSCLVVHGYLKYYMSCLQLKVRL